MQTWTAVTSIMLALGGLMALVGVWMARSGAARVTLVILLVGFLGAVFADTSSLLGRAKPVSLEWLQPHIAQATVLGSHPVEDEGIYLTLLLSQEQKEPRLYRIPWDSRIAQQLMDAQTQAQEGGTQVIMSHPFEASLDRDEPLFYAPPQPKLPDKSVPLMPVMIDQ